MDLAKEQLSEVICKHSERENGLQDLMEIMIESMMMAERREYLMENTTVRRVTRMRGAMPNEESVLLLMGKTAMDKKTYLRQVPRIDLDKTLFPDEKNAVQSCELIRNSEQYEK